MYVIWKWFWERERRDNGEWGGVFFLRFETMNQKLTTLATIEQLRKLGQMNIYNLGCFYAPSSVGRTLSMLAVLMFRTSVAYL